MRRRKTVGDRPWRWFVGQVGVVLVGVVDDVGVRGLTQGDALTAVRPAHRLVALERDLGLEHEPEVQQMVVQHERRVLYRRLRNAMLAPGVVGLVFFALHPVAPPRLTPLGLVDTGSVRSSAYRVLLLERRRRQPARDRPAPARRRQRAYRPEPRGCSSPAR